MITKIFEEIERFDTITIFRHVAADPDALGAQFGLKTWIEEKYPNKKVYALGEDLGSSAYLFPKIDKVSDEVIKSSLAILLDSANKERVDDKRYLSAKQTIRIDHHIQVETICNLEYIDTSAAATCEILALMFSKFKEELSSRCASYLYMGILTDTLRFSTKNTTVQTMNAASYLIQFGIDTAKLNFNVFSISKKEFYYENFLRSNIKEYNEKIAYIVVNKKEYESFGLTYNEAKEKVYVMGNVREYEIWCLFVEDQKNDFVYNGSLRSRTNAIREVASKYHGGGHSLACGVKGLSKETISLLLSDLEGTIKQK